MFTYVHQSYESRVVLRITLSRIDGRILPLVGLAAAVFALTHRVLALTHRRWMERWE
jgi:hypothetical protein